MCKKCEEIINKYLINEIDVSFYENNIEPIEKMHIFKYEDLVRKLILQYKFNDKSYLYRTFCEIILKNKKSFDFIKSYDIIIPVPIHKIRKRKIGYNQSELISKLLASKTKLEFSTNVLVKYKNNNPQSTLDKKARKENTKDVYKLVNKEKIHNKKVLIFDDIYTTGSTANACAKELKRADPLKIGILTLAKD